MNFTYIAKREITDDHEEGETYSIAIGPRAMEPSRSVVKNSIQAKDGTRETLHDRTDVFWDITTDVIREADLPLWKEFMASVEANEVFTFDPKGSANFTDDPRAVEMDGAYKPERIEMNPLYRLSFRLREV